VACFVSAGVASLVGQVHFSDESFSLGGFLCAVVATVWTVSSGALVGKDIPDGALQVRFDPWRLNLSGFQFLAS
jgi:hypothetical protein